MRIVHAVRQFHPSVGGLEAVVRELAETQAARGEQVRILTLDRVFGEASEARLAKHETLGDLEIVRVPFSGSSRYPVAPAALRHIRDADIVHVHGIDFFFDYFAATAPLHRRRLVVSTHGGFFHTSYARRLKRLYFPTVTRLSLSRYAGVAAVSAADEALFRSIRRRGISLIENGVNIDKYADAGSRTPARRIVVLGRFSSNKRLDRLVDFLAALRRRDPGWSVVIVGRESDLAAGDIRTLAERAGVQDALTVTVSPSDDEVRSILSGCSVIASASEYEGFGLSAVEGMSAGLFPLLSDIPPFERLVAQTGVGMTADFDRPDLAAARFLAEWQTFSANHAVGRAAAVEACARYGWGGVCDAYDAFYRSALGISVRSILGVPVDVSTAAHAVERLDRRRAHAAPTSVFFANAHTLNQAATSTRTRAALKRSIVFNDGLGVDLASRLLFGRAFPENLNGTDFVPHYLMHSRHRHRVFLLGGRPGIAARAAERIAHLAPRHEIAGCHHGYFDPNEADALIDTIRRSHADLLLVAMGDPRQQLWLMEHLQETGCRLGIGVGALFDFMAGAVPRAPDWVRAARLEWLYRVSQEPGRLWRRYFVGMPIFLLRVTRQWAAGPRIASAME
jgi:alpha-1,3-mannosyltransferase